MHIVVKIGSAVLMRSGPQGGALDRGAFCRLVDEIAQWVHAGHRVTLVSSGAVATGRRKMNLTRRPEGAKNIPVLQALAALGQSTLIQLYESEFLHHELHVAQLLLTRDDFNDRRRYLNARNALEAVHEFGAVPIINENDTVATDEIRFGDNDQLAALVATLTSADALVILSDIDGLYTANPHVDPNATRLPQVRALDPSLDAMVSGVLDPSAGFGTGGMSTKLTAARIAAQSNITTWIAPGKRPGALSEILHAQERGDLSTLTVGTRLTPDPDTDPIGARKAWIGLSTQAMGRLVCDRGATRAVTQHGKSLLATGLVRVEGDFAQGAIVELVNPDGDVFGRGLALYPSVDMERICGVQSAEIEGILGYKVLDAVVHRNDLVVLSQGSVKA